MKITVLSRYGRLGASSRLRVMQYLPCLQENGMVVTQHSLLDDRYLGALYEGRRAYRAVLNGYFGRILAVLKSRSSDLVWLEKEAFPWVPSLVEFGLLPRNTPLVIDIDDAVFHRYDLNGNLFVRSILGRKLDYLMRRARLVMAGSAYLVERARAAGCDWVEHVPTVVDLVRYPGLPKSSVSRNETVIGWIGSPSTAHYLHLVSPVLSALAHRYPIRCVAVGARVDQVKETPFQAVPWSERTEAEILQEMDIGIMPLPDGPWERGKCGYKLIQYMASRTPIIASGVGENRDIVKNGVNGFLAGTYEEWRSRIEELVRDADLRERMGNQGRRIVEREYCLNVLAPRVCALLKAAAIPT